jgi:hypothetical protein
MGRIVGIVSLIIVITLVVLLILGIWGIIPFNFLTIGKGALTGVILFFALAFVLAIYGMFFWKGTHGAERVLPSSSKEKAAMDAQRKSDQ